MQSNVAENKDARIASFRQFWPFYVREHSRLGTRTLHFIGSTLALICLWSLLWTREPLFFVAALVCGYGFAWVGHYGFEKNRPASFRRPLYSFMGDWRMYFDIWTGKIAI